MKIAFVLAYLADRFGGPVAAAKGIGRALAGAGHDVSYWATAGNGDSESLASLAGAHLFATDWPQAWYRSRGLAEGLAASVASLDVVELSEFWLYPIYAGSRIARRARVPYILRPAGSLQSWALTRSPAKRIKKSLYLRTLGNPILRHAACIRAASVREVEAVQSLGYDGPITIIPNGLNVAEFEGTNGSEAESYWPNLKDRPVVVFMSRLSSEKGLDLLIPAWAELVSCATYRNALLVVAGPDYRGYRRVVQAMIERHSIQRNVVLLDMVRGREKTSLLRRADIFVLPSYSENFGIVVAEALACGTPVITTTGAPWESLHRIDAGRWVAPRRGELVQALRELLNMSASGRKAMGRRGMDFVRSNYTWESAASQFLYVCDCIVRGRTIPLHPQSKMCAIETGGRMHPAT